MKQQKFILYKIFYNGTDGEYISYLGRTKQPINARLRGHFLKAPMTKLLDIFSVSSIETAECATEADMFLYEIYYINKFKPALNKDDKARDNLTINLPELEFKKYNTPLFEKWREQLKNAEETKEYEEIFGEFEK